jgi:hypothetical protein
MKFSTDIENEIDAIRDKIYNEVKDMPPMERVVYINSKAEAVMKQLPVAARRANGEGSALPA